MQAVAGSRTNVRLALFIVATRRAGESQKPRETSLRYRNLYQTRHTYASILLTAGEDPMWVAQQMGHKDWGMIRKIYGAGYPRCGADAGNRAAAALGQFWGKTETTQDDLGQTGATPDDDNPSDLAKKWRSGRDSNPRPPA